MLLPSSFIPPDKGLYTIIPPIIDQHYLNVVLSSATYELLYKAIKLSPVPVGLSTLSATYQSHKTPVLCHFTIQPASTTVHQPSVRLSRISAAIRSI